MKKLKARFLFVFLLGMLFFVPNVILALNAGSVLEAISISPDKKTKKTIDDNTKGNVEITNKDEISLVVSADGPTKSDAIATALRSAIEQAFGTFVSANTTILNDELVRDEIATITSGNIKGYKELSSSTLPNGNTSVSLQAVVSIGKLISYSQSHGSSAEFAGQQFMMQKRIQDLNAKNEQAALSNLHREFMAIKNDLYDYIINVENPLNVGIFNEQTAMRFDREYGYGTTVLINQRKKKDVYYNFNTRKGTYCFLALEPQNFVDKALYLIPLTIEIKANNNLNQFREHYIEVLNALRLSDIEVKTYKEGNLKPIHFCNDIYFRTEMIYSLNEYIYKCLQTPNVVLTKTSISGQERLFDLGLNTEIYENPFFININRREKNTPLKKQSAVFFTGELNLPTSIYGAYACLDNEIESISGFSFSSKPENKKDKEESEQEFIFNYELWNYNADDFSSVDEWLVELAELIPKLNEVAKDTINYLNASEVCSSITDVVAALLKCSSQGEKVNTENLLELVDINVIGKLSIRCYFDKEYSHAYKYATQYIELSQFDVVKKHQTVDLYHIAYIAQTAACEMVKEEKDEYNQEKWANKSLRYFSLSSIYSPESANEYQIFALNYIPRKIPKILPLTILYHKKYPSNNYFNSVLEAHGIKGIEFEDLGLPSGTLWATCNVGASSPLDYGKYVYGRELLEYFELLPTFNDFKELYDFNKNYFDKRLPLAGFIIETGRKVSIGENASYWIIDEDRKKAGRFEYSKIGGESMGHTEDILPCPVRLVIHP